jgi:Golgi phosphoprotein 3 (GPP34)
MERTLPEQAFLLLLDPATGRLPFGYGMQARFVVAGAALADLARAGCVRLERGRVVPAAGPPPRDAFLATTLSSILAARRPRRASTWVARLPVLRHVTRQLHDRGTLLRDEGRVLGVFPIARWRTADRGPREALVAACLGQRAFDDDLAILATALDAARLLRPMLPRGSRRDAKRRVRALAMDPGLAASTREAIALADDGTSGAVAAVAG